MIRREFLEVLVGLPFLGFLKGKSEDDQDIKDIKDSLESLKFPDGKAMDFETFSHSLNTASWVQWSERDWTIFRD
jgi:hypothetical protein